MEQFCVMKSALLCNKMAHFLVELWRAMKSGYKWLYRIPTDEVQQWLDWNEIPKHFLKLKWHQKKIVWLVVRCWVNRQHVVTTKAPNVEYIELRDSALSSILTGLFTNFFQGNVFSSQTATKTFVEFTSRTQNSVTRINKLVSCYQKCVASNIGFYFDQ